jgi:hypothetical protein
VVGGEQHSVRKPIVPAKHAILVRTTEMHQHDPLIGPLLDPPSEAGSASGRSATCGVSGA